MPCAKFGFNWPDSGSGEDENVKNLQTDLKRAKIELLNSFLYFYLRRAGSFLSIVMCFRYFFCVLVDDAYLSIIEIHLNVVLNFLTNFISNDPC